MVLGTTYCTPRTSASSPCGALCRRSLSCSDSSVGFFPRQERRQTLMPCPAECLKCELGRTVRLPAVDTDVRAQTSSYVGRQSDAAASLDRRHLQVDSIDEALCVLQNFAGRISRERRFGQSSCHHSELPVLVLTGRTDLISGQQNRRGRP